MTRQHCPDSNRIQRPRILKFIGLRQRLIALSLLFLATACGSSGGSEPTPAPPPTVASVALIAPRPSLMVGTTITLAATALDAAGRTISGRTTVWASSDTLVLTVTSAGLVTAVTPGSADVSATIDARSTSVRFAVTAVPVASVDVVAPAGPPPLELDTLRLTATPKTAAGTPILAAITWESRDTAVATVASDGLVTLRRRGSVEIRVTAASDEHAVTGSLVLQIGARSVETIIVEPGSLTVEAGLTRAVRVRALALSGVELLGRTPAFVVSGGDVAAVDASGVVTGRSEGTTALTVTVDGRSTTVPVVVTRRREITRILDSIRVAYGVPALAAAIVTPGGLWAMDAVGVRRAGTSIATSVADRFHIGSNLKAVTSALSGRLVDAGRVSWGLTMAQAFPEIAATMRPEYRTVTLLDLLSHRSGLPPNPTIGFADPTPRQQRAAAAAWALQQPPATAVGTYNYGNLGYIVAGAILERAANRSYESMVIEEVFTPLGGGTTVGFGAPAATFGDAQPSSHFVDAAGVRTFANGDNPPVFSPAGRAHLSLDDWARYVRAVLVAERGGTSIWSTATAQRLTTIAAPFADGEGYALGWMRLTRSWGGGGTVLWHNGSNNANYSEAWIVPARGFAIIVVTNQGPLSGTTPAQTAATRAVGATSARLIALFSSGR